MKVGGDVAVLKGMMKSLLDSNVQGDRTVGITGQPDRALREGIRMRFGFTPPGAHGHDAVAAVKAICEGRSKALICLGGNLAMAMPDPQATFAGMARLDLAVHIATKLNRSHLILARESIILPCLGRTELDVQASGYQSVTVEDSMSMVHASQGRLKPAGPLLKSEPAIVAMLARATLPHSKVEWQALVEDYDRIRDAIEAMLPIFARYNERVREPGGFRRYIAASRRVGATPDQHAHFLIARRLGADSAQPDGTLTLTTIHWPVHHHRLWHRRPLPRHQRAPRRDLHPPAGPGRPRPAPRRPHRRRCARQRGQWQQPARHARLYQGGLRDRARLGGDVLPGHFRVKRALPKTAAGVPADVMS